MPVKPVVINANEGSNTQFDRLANRSIKTIRPKIVDLLKVILIKIHRSHHQLLDGKIADHQHVVNDIDGEALAPSDERIVSIRVQDNSLYVQTRMGAFKLDVSDKLRPMLVEKQPNHEKDQDEPNSGMSPS